jgi:hypothetical protein
MIMRVPLPSQGEGQVFLVNVPQFPGLVRGPLAAAAPVPGQHCANPNSARIQQYRP